MIEQNNYASIVMAIVLILIGIFYPSNGVDDKIYASTSELFSRILFMFSIGLIVSAGLYLRDIYKSILKTKNN